jgi:hypothetical protein
VLPHFQLDAVLTQEELADEVTKQEALAILQCAAGNQWVFWTVSGLIVALTSAVGLYVSPNLKNQPQET